MGEVVLVYTVILRGENIEGVHCLNCTTLCYRLTAAKFLTANSKEKKYNQSKKKNGTW